MDLYVGFYTLACDLQRPCPAKLAMTVCRMMNRCVNVSSGAKAALVAHPKIVLLLTKVRASPHTHARIEMHAWHRTALRGCYSGCVCASRTPGVPY
jgi:hypothetical protein